MSGKINTKRTIAKPFILKLIGHHIKIMDKNYILRVDEEKYLTKFKTSYDKNMNFSKLKLEIS